MMPNLIMKKEDRQQYNESLRLLFIFIYPVSKDYLTHENNVQYMLAKLIIIPIL